MQIGIKRLNITKLPGHPLFPGVTVFVFIFTLNAVLDPRFFTAGTVYGNFSVLTPVIIATIAQSIVILGGNIDLSIGASISLINCILAVTLVGTLGADVLGLGIALAAALSVSLVNGILVAYLGLPSMVATFAMSTVLAGITLWVLPIPGGFIPRWLPDFYAFQIGGVVPVTAFILLFVGLILYCVSRTRFGRYIYAVGGNEAASAASGINSKKIKLYSFLLSGFFIWLTALAVTGQTGAGDFRLGTPFTLTSIAASIMGGIAITGGKGRMLGAALGGAAMMLITNVIFFARIPSFYQDMIRGMIVIVALFIAAVPKLRKLEN